MLARRVRLLVAGAMLAGLALRLAFALGYWHDKPLTHDEQEYLALAINMASGRGFSRDLAGAFEGPSVDRFSRAPLYPAILAAVFQAAGGPPQSLPASVPRSVQVFQALVGALGIWVISRLAARAAGDVAGTAAAWLAALHPVLIWSCAFALSEVVYAPLVLGCALLLGRASGPGWLLAAGVLAGLAALVRSSALVFVPLAALWLFWRRRPLSAVAFVLATLIVVAPWTARNYRVHGRPIVVAADGGVTFWTGNHPLARGEGDLAANPELKRVQRAFLARHPGLSPEQLEPLYYREALGFIARDPAWWLGLLARKFFYTWVPIGPSYRLHSGLYYWGSVVPYVVLFPLAAVAFWRLRQSPRFPGPLMILAASSALVCLIFFPQERFRIPVIDPVLVVGAAAWFATRKGDESLAAGYGDERH